MSKKLKHNPTPWDFLAQYKGTYFKGEWPTVPEAFEISTARYPKNACFHAFVPKPLSFNYTQALATIKGVANYMLLNGVKSGDRVAVCGKNSPEWAIAFLAVGFAGAVVVPLDHALSAADLDRQMAFAGVKFLLADEDCLASVDADGSVGLTNTVCLEPKGTPYILDCQIAEEQPRTKAKEEELAAILFTSGTTGIPKGVMLSHRNLIADCYLAQGNMNIYSTDVFYAILPIHHAYTMLAVFIESFSVGAETVFGKKLVISQVLKELKEGKVTMFLGVPMLFNKMLGGLMDGVKKKGALVYGLIRGLMGISGFVKKVFKVNPGHKWFGFLLKNLSLDTNRICICGGGPLPPSTFKKFNELGIDFVQGYGLTETSPIVTLNPIFAYEETSVGKLVPQCEAKIVNPDADGNGVIYLRGPMIMMGYYKNPEATAEILDADGWLNTGDVGHIDSKDYVYLTGRAKNVIVTDGGKNVFPEEIEDHFQLYGEVDQVCVLGYITDVKTHAEGIRAIFYPSESFRNDVEKQHPDAVEAAQAVRARINEIVEEINKEVPPYKKISKVTVINEAMPMTSTKKIKRFLVAQKYKDQ